MPGRVTRAALRSNATALEAEAAAGVPLPLTPRKERAPLGEIAGNAADAVLPDAHTSMKPKKTSGGKGKKAAETKKTEIVNKEEVLEDDNRSTTSSAVEDACEELRKDPIGPPPNVLHEETITQRDNADTVAMDTPKADEDSFVNQIVTRTPVKQTSRIEDSVEAIDTFEDEIEKVGEQLPAIGETVSSAKVQKSQNAKATNPITTKRQGNGGCFVTKKRVSSIYKTPFQPVKSSKPATVSNFELPGDAVARKLKEQREARLASGGSGEAKPSKAAPKVVKSTKPPTRSSFELPGDAVARKLKERREERLKQQDEAGAHQQKDCRSRTVRLSSAPTVRPTATSRARISLAQGGALENSKPKTKTGKGPTITRPSITLSNANNRLSSLSVPKRASTITSASARPSLAGRATPRLSSATPSQRLTSNGKPTHQTSRGKEVFERNKTAKDELEKGRREKEEAAKKARIEAAERGRIASRQWAEKQKARKASAEKGGTEGEMAAIAA